ncbi:MAG: hypothetical protein KC417_12010, partial [Myxococcales bacterium]|nr:hypothetical protein [Myxococcales bacterium]
MRRIKRTGRGACHLALVLWATFVLGGAAHAEAPDALDRLLASFAQVEGFEAQFREEKHIALLVAPLVNEGGVHYARPGMFARHTRTPERKSLVVRAGKVEFGTAAKGERVDTAKNPLARQVVDAYLGLVGGDR